MKARKSKIFTAVPPKDNRYHKCEYQLWNSTEKRLHLCGAAALAVKGEKGGHIAYLCGEHAQFYIDAYDLRSEEEKVLEEVDERD